MRSRARDVGEAPASSTMSYENEDDRAGSLSCEIEPSLTDCSVAPSRLAACTRVSASTSISLMCEMAASRDGPPTVRIRGEAGEIDARCVHFVVMNMYLVLREGRGGMLEIDI
jgi:hypothetical protein